MRMVTLFEMAVQRMDEKPEDAQPAGRGVDRSAIRQRLSLTPRERALVAVQEARNMDAFRRRLPK